MHHSFKMSVVGCCSTRNSSPSPILISEPSAFARSFTMRVGAPANATSCLTTDFEIRTARERDHALFVRCDVLSPVRLHLVPKCVLAIQRVLCCSMPDFLIRKQRGEVITRSLCMAISGSSAFASRFAMCADTPSNVLSCSKPDFEI